MMGLCLRCVYGPLRASEPGSGRHPVFTPQATLACPRLATMFPRFLRPIHHSSTRSYSLFSKPPGGRFFNSSKPPKVVPPASASPKSATRVEASTANGDTQQQQASSSSPDDSSTSTSSPPNGTSPAILPAPLVAPIELASHPPLSAPDLRLHQFFSQHRPLVLTQPAAALFDSCPTLALNPAPPHGPGTTTRAAASVPQATLEDPPETTPEADSDTARLLARTLAMNAVSSAVSWDATLRRLGLHPAENTAAAALEGHGLTVELDSTHRKRRKKMKKHKCVKCSIVPFPSWSSSLLSHFRLKKRRRVSCATFQSYHPLSDFFFHSFNARND